MLWLAGYVLRWERSWGFDITVKILFVICYTAISVSFDVKWMQGYASCPGETLNMCVIINIFIEIFDMTWHLLRPNECWQRKHFMSRLQLIVRVTWMSVPHFMAVVKLQMWASQWHEQSDDNQSHLGTTNIYSKFHSNSPNTNRYNSTAIHYAMQASSHDQCVKHPLIVTDHRISSSHRRCSFRV